jgi:intracellular sulfur oxidation DsrE/DsrF family protein
MINIDPAGKTARRGFLGFLAKAAALTGFTAMLPGIGSSAFANTNEGIESSSDPADEWFKKIKGDHRIVFDATRSNELMPFAYPRIFFLTNEKTGTPESKCGVVMVFRHDAIPFAFDDKLWGKYKFSDVFNVTDPVTKEKANRNPFWNTKPDDFSIPGIGNVKLGIRDLQAAGVMFCVCDMAITIFAAGWAEKKKGDAAEIKAELLSGVLPGIQVVPSGVWAVGRAQEQGCKYCLAG